MERDILPQSTEPTRSGDLPNLDSLNDMMTGHTALNEAMTRDHVRAATRLAEDIGCTPQETLPVVMECRDDCADSGVFFAEGTIK